MLEAIGRRVRLLKDLSCYDAVFVHREAALIGPEFLERWVVRIGLPLIYGLDDPLFVPYRSPTNGSLSRLKFPSKVARVCSLAKSVIVNSRPLQGFGQLYNSNVWIIPSLLDGSAFEPRTYRSRTPVVLGWSGSRSSAFNVDYVAQALGRLARNVPFELHIVGAERQTVGEVPCTSQPWVEATEVEDLQRFDVGLVPMGPHPWNDWKFSLKLAQYMALGIPAVGSPVGAIPDQIQHGVTGFLAATSDDWVRYLEELITNEPLRRRMGAAAAEYAHRHFTIAANEDAIVGAFRSALEPESRSRSG
jgi:glycosyltransferase involved in cell wall biosynthesis